MKSISRGLLSAATLTLGLIATGANAGVVAPEHSIARQWNDTLLDSIRNDLARPVVHSRNLFHHSIAMWDAWAAYGENADQYLHQEKAIAADVVAARREAISFASYRLLVWRFTNSAGAAETLQMLDAKMDEVVLAYGFAHDRSYTDTVGDNPAALGNRIAETIITTYINDGGNETGDYANLVYEPVNPPLVPALPGNPTLVDPNRWQPLALQYFVDQGGNVIVGGYPEFLGAEWGQVVPFALLPENLAEGKDWVYHDPGPPPQIGSVGDDYYKWGNEMVSVWSAHLDPSDGVIWDISPASRGNTPLAESSEWADYYQFFEGNDWGTGFDLNPETGLPYEPNMVPRGDYGRVLAEFWADGPDSETPPGHWFTLLNYVNDHPLFEKRWRGEGPILDDLRWDVQSYLAMGGAMHDVAVSAWGVKGWYDYIRPISAIRYMCDKGQCSDTRGPSYHPEGINLHPGLVEVVTLTSIAPGERHAHLAGKGNENVGKIAVMAWRGPEYIDNPDIDEAGVGWILAENWWPYQRPSFVTPPFAGYVSGHSTFSRAASELMTLMTGSEFFPGGLGEFHCPQNEFLVFEEGPSVDVVLQWATYTDASDQTSLSRIWGGIHPPADDLPGRHMGLRMGPDALDYAEYFIEGRISCPANLDNASPDIDMGDLMDIITSWGPCPGDGNWNCPEDLDGNGVVGFADLVGVLNRWGPCS